MSASRGLRAAGALALPYLLLVAGYEPRGIAGAAVVGLVAVAAPGAAGMLLGRGRDPARRVSQALAGAAAANVVALVARRALGVAADPPGLAATLGAITTLAGGLGAARGGTLPRVQPSAAIAAGGAFLLAAWAGLHVVPPLEDQDSEVQGTAWGLVHDLEPVCLTNRGTLHYFAHPPLLHVFAATSLGLSGELPAVRPAYDAARRERKKSPADARRGFAAVRAALGGEARRPDRYIAWRRDVFGAFLRNPALLGTRAPSFVFAATGAALVFLWVRRLGTGPADAALVTAAYATLPEIVVRSGYGGYHALVTAVTLAAAWLHAQGGGARSGFAAGALAALADQKTLLLGAAAGAASGLRALRDRAAVHGARPLLAGMLLGTAAFWAWGLVLAPADFVSDHWREHGLARFGGGTVAAGPGALEYPSPAGLWAEFARHSGPWSILALAAAAAGARRVLRGPDEARGSSAVLGAWILLVALAGTLADWRQTKHLALLVPAATILIGALAAEVRTRGRIVLRIMLVLSVAWNVSWVARLAADFGSLSPRPLW